MTFLLILFIVIIALEIACLVGLIYLWIWIETSRGVVDGAREALPLIRTTLTGRLHYGEMTVKQAIGALGMIERLLPRWLKLIYNSLRWMGKIKT